MVAIPLPLRSGPAPFKFLGETRLRNCFPEVLGDDKKQPVAILCAPGVQAFTTPSNVISRGMLPSYDEQTLYSVHGATLYSIVSAGTATAVDGIIAGSDPVIMECGPSRFQSSEVTISAASPAVVNWTNHRLASGTPIQFATTGSLPDGIEAAKTYYVIAAGLTTNSFEFSETEGGSAVDTTGGQSGTHTAIRGTATYQLVVVSGGVAYCLEDGYLSFIDIPDEVVNSVTYLDGRWVFGCDSGKFFYSELNNARSVDALSFATAEARPDGLVRAAADGGELWLYGKTTVQVYSGTGDADGPFAPLGGSFIDKGCASRDSVVSFDNAPHWLGHDLIYYRGQGYQAQRVSDHSVERDIARVSDPTTIRGFSYTEDGHSFLVLTCALWTWVFDAATGKWCERNSHGRPDWRAWPYAKAFRKHFVGDKASGAIREMKTGLLTENGLPIRMEMILPDISGDAVFKSLELLLNSGAGLLNAEGELGHEPLVMLSWSDDGGYTWSDERTVSIGKRGDYAKIVRFFRLGSSRNGKGRRFKIAMSDPVVRSFALADIVAEAA